MSRRGFDLLWVQFSRQMSRRRRQALLLALAGKKAQQAACISKWNIRRKRRTNLACPPGSFRGGWFGGPAIDLLPAEKCRLRPAAMQRAREGNKVRKGACGAIAPVHDKVAGGGEARLNISRIRVQAYLCCRYNNGEKTTKVFLEFSFLCDSTRYAYFVMTQPQKRPTGAISDIRGNQYFPEESQKRKIMQSGEKREPQSPTPKKVWKKVVERGGRRVL